ncbi:hypothetical protein YC2023_017092 [Brassica napus]
MAKGDKQKETSSQSGVDERGRESTATRAGTQQEKSVSREALGVAVGEMGDKLETVEHTVTELESVVFGGLEEVKQNAADLDSRFIRLEELVTGSMQALRDDIEGMKARFTAMEEDITLVKRASANAGAVGGTSFGKVELPKPNRFNGVRDAKEVENFLWQMEIYFDNLSVVAENAKVKAATSYLSDTAMLWWRRKHSEIEQGTCRIDTWDDFKKELKRQFYPENVIYEARKKLREIRQRGSIRDYVKEFTTLILQIPNMTAEDLVFYFTDGLQSWAKQELQRRGVKTVDEAIAVAESLIDFRTSGPSESSKKKEQVVAKGGGAKRDTGRPSNSRSFEKGVRREDFEARKKSFVPKGGCFVCKGPHAMKDCPKMGSLSAIMESRDPETPEGEQGKMGSLQLLNALKANPVVKPTSKGLMYVEAWINDKPTRVMVDTGATHNFMATDEAVRLGIKWSKKDGWMKTVNARAQPVNGIARGVGMKLGSWSGPVNFSVIPMDDFKVVLGMDFMRQVSAIPMPALSSVCILEKGSPCMIPTLEEKSEGTKQLSAMQLTKGVKKGEPTFLAMMKVEDEPNKVEDIPQTQKKLSPKQARWQDFLAEFDYTLEYKPGKVNVVADALSRKAELAAMSQVKGTIMARIREGLERDPVAKELVKLSNEGKVHRFWVEDGLLYTKGRRLYVPKWESLRRDIIRDYLCHFVSANQRDWAKLLDIAQFSYNLQRSEATGRSPFELATGQQPLTPHTLATPRTEGKSPGAFIMAKQWEEHADLARACLEKSRKRMKKWADEKRRPSEYSVGDLVLVKLLPQQFKAFRSLHKGLIRKYEGPFEIVGKVGKVSYRIDLPDTLKIHPVFHVSMLKPYHADEDDQTRRVWTRAPPVVTKSYDKEVEEVLASKEVRKRGVPRQTHFLIKWKGLPEAEATWESEEDLWQFRDILKAYTATRASPA